jgi:hypothetical protein
MTSQGGPGHAANDAGRDDRTLPLSLSPRLNRCHPQNVPAGVARTSLDRHATCIVAAYVAGAAR